MHFKMCSILFSLLPKSSLNLFCSLHLHLPFYSPSFLCWVLPQAFTPGRLCSPGLHWLFLPRDRLKLFGANFYAHKTLHFNTFSYSSCIPLLPNVASVPKMKLFYHTHHYVLLYSLWYDLWNIILETFFFCNFIVCDLTCKNILDLVAWIKTSTPSPKH